MKIHLMILLLLSLALTACGAERAPEETADPLQIVQPAEDASPDEPEDPASARGIPPLEGTPLTEEELAQVNEAFNAYGKPDGGRALEYACFFTSSYEDVTELNLEEFLRYYFNGSGEVLDGDAEEFRALAALPGFPFSEGIAGGVGEPPRRPAGARPPHPPGGGGRDPGGLRRNYHGGFEEYRRDFVPPGLRCVL